MHLVRLYYSNIQDWDFEDLSYRIVPEDMLQFSSIRHETTRKLKMLNRVLLRSILKDQYGVEDGKISFEYNDRGKPYLKNHRAIMFNCSHSGDLVFIGISINYEIGVDIELIQELADEDAIAANFFSSIEYENYRNLRQQNPLPSEFYKFWTAKEAIVKAFGKGLWETKKVPEIALQHGEFLLINHSELVKNWCVKFVEIDKRYMACFVVNCENVEINVSCLKSLSCK